MSVVRKSDESWKAYVRLEGQEYLDGGTEMVDPGADPALEVGLEFIAGVMYDDGSEFGSWMAVDKLHKQPDCEARPSDMKDRFIDLVAIGVEDLSDEVGFLGCLWASRVFKKGREAKGSRFIAGHPADCVALTLLAVLPKKCK